MNTRISDSWKPMASMWEFRNKEFFFFFLRKPWSCLLNEITGVSKSCPWILPLFPHAPCIVPLEPKLTAQTRLPPGKQRCNQHTLTLYVSIDHLISWNIFFLPFLEHTLFWLTLKAGLRLEHNNTIFHHVISYSLDLNFKDIFIGWTVFSKKLMLTSNPDITDYYLIWKFTLQM